ncbi:MAG: hypothetical protein ABSB69_15415 [Solirubrobacteraceae bacterium]
MAKRNPGRRGRSRKRRPNPQSSREPAPRVAPAARPSVRAARALGELKAVGDRPQAPWHPLPLSELLIFVGAIGTVVAWLRGIQSNGALLGAGIGAVVIGTIEVTLREHLGGFRSHTLMLSMIPAIVFHSAVVLVVLAVANRAPSWLNIALLPVDVALVVVVFKLLRARYVDARRERTFAGLR